MARAWLVAPLSAAVLLAACGTPQISPEFGRYIVQLADVPLADYARNAKGSGAGPAPGVAVGPDLGSAQNQEYLAHLKAEQVMLVDSMTRALGRRITPVIAYYVALDGMVVVLTADEAARIATLPGVVSVRPDTTRPPVSSGSVPRRTPL